MKNPTNIKIDLSIPAPLFLVFFILKLTGTVSWPWWVVTAPLWVPLLLGGGVLMVVALLILIFAVFK